MTPKEAVGRARLACGHGCVYVLGKGGMSPLSDFPFDGNKECDCSGAANWFLGRSRFDGKEWWGTDQIDADASGVQSLFRKVPWAEARPGDLVVYPHQTPGHHGHVGLVTQTDGSGPSRVIHCSLGNFNKAGDAIQETGPAVFTLHGAIVARYLGYDVEAV